MSQPTTHRESDADRRVLVLTHTGRDEAREVARSFCKGLTTAGLGVRLIDYEAADLGIMPGDDGLLEVRPLDREVTTGCELAVVIGGDGTILRAAEITHATGTPLLGVNLGHVGFLAEAESDAVEETVDAIVHCRYGSEERLTVDVDVYADGERVATTWALNEVSLEKALRQKMIEVVIEVDGRPLSQFGCDGVVCATPTGSTAYNFSAGGPVVWPDVAALLLVPISAHALFNRPLVVSPDSILAVEVQARADGDGVLWADGRRTIELPAGARVEVRRGAHPVRLVRLHAAPFTDRLVAKFDLPVEGWRGAAERRRAARAELVDDAR